MMSSQIPTLARGGGVGVSIDKCITNSHLHKVEDKQKINPCTSFQSCSMFHFETATSRISEFSQCVTENRNAISLKKASPLDFQQFNYFKYWKMCLCARMLAFGRKGRAFIEKVNSRCFCWFPAAIFVYQNCTKIWRLQKKLYNGAWNTSQKRWAT